MPTIKSVAFVEMIESHIPPPKTFAVNSEVIKKLELAGLDIISSPEHNVARIQKRDNAKGFFMFFLAENGDFIIQVNYNFYDLANQKYVADFTNCKGIGGDRHWYSQWCGKRNMSSMYGEEAQAYMESMHSAIMNSLGVVLDIETELPFFVLKRKFICPDESSREARKKEKEYTCLFTRSELEQAMRNGE